MKKIKRFRINVRRSRVLQILKYQDSKTLHSEEMKYHIIKEIHDAYKFINPATVYESFDKEKVTFLFDKSENVKELLKDSIAVSVIIVTIGDGIEKEIEVCTKKELLSRASILDAIGSEAVEQSINFVTKLLKEEAALEDLDITKRFSPGYGDWNVMTNIEIMKVIKSEKIKIDVLDTGLLLPQKSITAILGWQKKNSRGEKK
jgi:hypothetical protein